MRALIAVACLVVPITAQAGAGAHSVEVAATDADASQAFSLRLQRSRTQPRGARSIFDGAGTDTLMLPGDWTAAPTTAGMDAASDGTLLELRTLRERLDASWRRRFDAWKVDGGLRVERRRGLDSAGGTFGSTGGNARAALLPRPIDHETREWRFSATRSSGRQVFRVEGLLASFHNAQSALHWQNPFAGVAGWGPGADWPEGVGQLAAAPDNRARNLAAAWAWRGPGGTHLNLDASLGRHEQDAPFLPYTANPALSVPVPLPRSSLDGRVDLRRMQAQLRIPVAPAHEASLRWRDERHDDRTDAALFLYPAGDAAHQPGIDDAGARWRLPRDHQRQRIDAGWRWRVAPRDRVHLDLEREAVERAYAEVTETTEDRIAIGWRRHGAHGSHLRVERAERDAGAYRGDRPWHAYHTDEYIASVAPELRFENHPLLRRFNLADRTRTGARGGHAWTGDAWHAAMLANVHGDRYSDSVFGLTDSRQRGMQFELGHVLTDDQHLSAWISRERWETRQHGRHFRGAGFLEADLHDPGRDWRAVTEDRMTALGAAWRHRAPWPNGELGVDVSYARSAVDVAVTAGAAIDTAPLPAVVSRVTRVRVSAAHDFSPAWTLRAALDHERWSMRDWSNDGVGPGTVATVLGMSETLPNRSFGWASVSLEWRP